MRSGLDEEIVRTAVELPCDIIQQYNCWMNKTLLSSLWVASVRTPDKVLDASY